MPRKTDPKHIIFNLNLSADWVNPVSTDLSKVSNPQIFNIDQFSQAKKVEAYSDDLEKLLIDKLRYHISKYGTVNELVITGHGNSETMLMGNGEEGNPEINTASLLEKMHYLQQEMGMKIVNRIVFAGCNTLSKLTNEKIKLYRDYAKQNNIEVVGTTSYMYADGNISIEGGRFAKFTPKGGVERDGLDSKYNLLVNIASQDTSWTDYHLNHTQGQAETQINNDLKKMAIECLKYRPFYMQYERDKIAELDWLTDNTDVLITKDGKGSIIISDDGQINTYGKAKLHHLSDKERQNKEVVNIELLAKKLLSDGTISEADIISIGLWDESEKDAKEERFCKVVVSNDRQKIMIATQTGGYEVLNASSCKPNTTPAVEKDSTPTNRSK